VVSTFNIVKTHDGTWAVLSSGGTSVTGKRFRYPLEAERWVKRNYQNVNTVRLFRGSSLQMVVRSADSNGG